MTPHSLCKYCGSPVPEKGLRFCNRSCYDQSRKKRLQCRVCRVSFYRPNHRVGTGKAFCTQDCRDKWGASRGYKLCPRCKEAEPLADFIGSYCSLCSRFVDRERRVMPTTRFANARSAAKRNGRTWLLTLAEFRLLIILPCHYCGRELERSGSGLDRKDTTRGYETDNVVPCCKRCNAVKMDHFTYAQMVYLAKTIREIDADSI